MTSKELRKAVGRGQGRAILFLRERGGVGYEELILNLCLKDQTFDHMFENRDDYMCRLADTHPNPLELVQPLGERLFQSRNRRDRQQIRAILAHLAKKGSAEASEFLRKDFYRFNLKDRSFADAVSLLGREGLELLLGQAHRLEDWEWWSVYDDAVEQLGKRFTEKAFNRLAPGKADLVSEMKQGGKQKAPSKEPTPKEFIEQLREGKYASYATFFRDATEEDWRAVATLALTTSDQATLRRIGTLFGKKPWPFGAEESLNRAVAEPNSERRFYLLRMLRTTRSPAIRAWSLEQIAHGKPADDWESAFGLLRLNAEPEDCPILTRALLRVRDMDELFHDVGRDILELRCGSTVEMLQILYENVSCDLCRNSTIRDLVKLRAMTREQWIECAEDSEEDTRKMARRWIKRG